MELQTDDPDFYVSQPHGLPSEPRSVPSSPGWASQYQSRALGFSVSWLLGLQPTEDRSSAHLCGTRTGFGTRDPSFTVSRLLTLNPWPRSTTGGELAGRCPLWASEFEFKEHSFDVSHVLGLVPKPAEPTTAANGTDEESKLASSDKSENSEEQAQVEEEEAEAGEVEEDSDELAIQRIFGDIPYDGADGDDANDADNGNTGEDATEEDASEKIHTTPEFLELCARMEDLLAEIE